MLDLESEVSNKSRDKSSNINSIELILYIHE